MQSLRENLLKRVAPPSPKTRSNSNSRKALLDALAAQERLAKAGESSFRAASVLGLHFDNRASKRGLINYDSAAASRAGVNIHDPEGCFHILSNSPFTQRGICFPSVHHFVMAERFKGSPIEAEIPAAASLWEIDRLCEIGEQNEWERPDWPQVRLNALIVGTFLKFRQNPDALKVLIRTKQRTIVQENLPSHYQKWIAHEKVEKKRVDDAGGRDDYLYSSASRSARNRSKSASEFLNEKVHRESGAGQEEKTVITGSSHRNLGGAVLMSLRKKLILAFQYDEKARIKKRQMEILAQQMEEAKKKEVEVAAKAAAKAALEPSSKPKNNNNNNDNNNNNETPRRAQSNNNNKFPGNRSRTSSSTKKKTTIPGGKKFSSSTIVAAGKNSNANNNNKNHQNTEKTEEEKEKKQEQEKEEQKDDQEEVAVLNQYKEEEEIPSEADQQKELDEMQNEILADVMEGQE